MAVANCFYSNRDVLLCYIFEMEIRGSPLFYWIILPLVGTGQNDIAKEHILVK